MFKGVDFVSVHKEPNDDYFSNYWLTTILVDDNNEEGISREALRLALLERNIESRPLWKPLHLQPVFRKYDYYGSNIAEKLFEKGLCLPSGSNLTEEEKMRIRDVIEFFLMKKNIGVK